MNIAKEIEATPWCPDKCPITGREFFCWIENEDGTSVPTYGGPFDSYTLPEPDKDGCFTVRCYDHDMGGWNDYMSLGLRLIDDQREDYPFGTVDELKAELAALRQRVEGAVGPIDYVPGELDRTAPERIWLQIDTGGDNAERDEPWPGADGVTWQDEEIGGLEIQYIRADLAAPAVPHRVDALRGAQAQAVMPLIGPLLDAWEQAYTDDKQLLQETGIAERIEAIADMMENHPVPAAPAAVVDDPIRALISAHAQIEKENPYAYFELAYSRQTGWMAWITDKPLCAPIVNPDRKVLATGQGETAGAACAAALSGKQGGAE